MGRKERGGEEEAEQKRSSLGQADRGPYVARPCSRAKPHMQHKREGSRTGGFGWGPTRSLSPVQPGYLKFQRCPQLSIQGCPFNSNTMTSLT